MSPGCGTANYDSPNLECKAFIRYSSGWSLKSLTIGPQVHQNADFWTEAFKDLPPLPRVDTVTIIYHYPGVEEFDTGCWGPLNRMLARQDLFPALKLVEIWATCGRYRLDIRKWLPISSSLRAAIGRRGVRVCRLFEFAQGPKD